jgi:hypothetical protein
MLKQTSRGHFYKPSALLGLPTLGRLREPDSPTGDSNDGRCSARTACKRPGQCPRDSLHRTFNLAVGPGPLATLTFTHVRNKTGPLIDQSQIDPESVVRARIVTTLENLAALRDLLNTMIQDPATPAANAGGSSKLN